MCARACVCRPVYEYVYVSMCMYVYVCAFVRVCTCKYGGFKLQGCKLACKSESQARLV
jgi:hypothetical protein